MGAPAYLKRYEPEVGVISSLLRFPILFFIWGSVGFVYKVFMNLSPGGFVLSMLFFATCALVVLGWMTRLSMAALGAILMVHGYIHGGTGSILCGVVAALSALLPLGEYYSLDRYLKLQTPPGFYDPVTPTSAPRLSPPVMLLFALLAAFMIGGPTYNQIFHHQNKMFRSWDMFHRIGAQIVNVHFFYAEAGRRRDTDYMEELGHKGLVSGTNRDENKPYRRDLNLVGAHDLESLIARVCASSRTPSSLRVEARIASMKDGWRELYKGSEPVCLTHVSEKTS
ncbi:hypothetical protein [Rhizorhabdus argentea]|uniref:hypothetical protein n=1 Tax=Rhizorhabdus argentea TaxID=1387174 RepID=UPI0030EE929D